MEALPIVASVLKALDLSESAWILVRELRTAPKRVQFAAQSLRFCHSYMDKMRRLYASSCRDPNADGYDDHHDLRELLEDFTRTCADFGRLLKPYTVVEGSKRIAKQGLWIRVRWRINKASFHSIQQDLRHLQDRFVSILIAETHSITGGIQYDGRKVLSILRRAKKIGSVSDEDENDLKSEFDAVELVQKHIRYQGSFETQFDPRTRPSSLVGSDSPSLSNGERQTPNIDAVIRSNAMRPIPTPSPIAARKPQSGHLSLSQQPAARAVRAVSHADDRSGRAGSGNRSQITYQGRDGTEDTRHVGDISGQIYDARLLSERRQQQAASRQNAMGDLMPRRVRLPSADQVTADSANYHFVTDSTGRVIARSSALDVPSHSQLDRQVSEMRSAPELVDIVHGQQMTRPQTTEYVSGFLAALRTEVGSAVRHALSDPTALRQHLSNDSFLETFDRNEPEDRPDQNRYDTGRHVQPTGYTQPSSSSYYPASNFRNVDVNTHSATRALVKKKNSSDRSTVTASIPLQGYTTTQLLPVKASAVRKHRSEMGVFRDPANETDGISHGAAQDTAYTESSRAGHGTTALRPRSTNITMQNAPTVSKSQQRTEMIPTPLESQTDTERRATTAATRKRRVPRIIDVEEPSMQSSTASALEQAMASSVQAGARKTRTKAVR